MYKVSEETIVIEGEVHTVYGVECDKIRVDNISPDRTAVEQLAEKFNQHNLNPIHLLDAVEDFLE